MNIKVEKGRIYGFGIMGCVECMGYVFVFFLWILSGSELVFGL